MTQDQIQQLLLNIKKYADQAAGFAEGFLPPQALIPVIAGKAIIDLIPGIEQDIADMISGVPRTPEQEAATAAKVAVLGDPAGL